VALNRGILVFLAAAIGVPLAFALPRLFEGVPTLPTVAAAPVVWAAPPPLSAALERPLFDAPAAAEALADAPELVGIVGRLDQDAVAMVRGRDGAMRTLRPGEGVDGWQLRSLAIDAAYFTRGTQSARVALAD
jgi:hypothetical protein